MAWIKAFHIVFMVSWYAGLLYLPRLFVYHAMTDDDVGHERFLVMETKLYRIMSVGAIGTLVFGAWLLARLWEPLIDQGWLHVKLLLVAVLLGYHGYCGKVIGDFRRRANQRGHVFYRLFNEVPAVMLIAITILVVVKPF